jgi:hypothetical protein
MKALIVIAAVVAATATAAPAFGDTFITDTLAPGGGQTSPYVAPAQHNRFTSDTLAPGGGPATPVVTVTSSGGFSWSDAAIGAGAASGALITLAGSTLLVGRQRRRLAV